MSCVVDTHAPTRLISQMTVEGDLQNSVTYCSVRTNTVYQITVLGTMQHISSFACDVMVIPRNGKQVNANAWQLQRIERSLPTTTSIVVHIGTINSAQSKLKLGLENARHVTVRT